MAICTIKFETNEEQAKAFGLLIHGKFKFSGVERDTIMLDQSACDMLDKNDVKYKTIVY